MDKSRKEFIQLNTDSGYRVKSFESKSESKNDDDLLLMLASLFDLKEYKKCAFFAQNRLKKQEKEGQKY